MAGVCEEGASTILRVYINGVEKAVNDLGEVVQIKKPSPSDAGKLCVIGTENNIQIGKPHLFVDGIIDEIRVSNVARNANWIKTCYNNQNSPSNFITVGDEEYVEPLDPVPDLPPIVLLGVGLAILAGYLWLRRGKQQSIVSS